MNRIIWVLVLVLMFPLAYADDDDDSNSSKENTSLFITEALVTFDDPDAVFPCEAGDDTITLKGLNFDNGKFPIVFMGEQGQLQVCDYSATHIRASCPPDPYPEGLGTCKDGDYRLIVDTQKRSKGYDEYDLTIRAAGAADPVLQEQSCPDHQYVTGIGPSGNLVCAVVAGLCSNGVTEAGEECDDGNLADGDGCSSTCLLEAEPSDCIPDNEEPSDAATPSNIGVGYSNSSLTLCNEEDVYKTSFLVGDNTLCLDFIHADGNIDVLVFSDAQLTQVAAGGLSDSDGEEAEINGTGAEYFVKVFMTAGGDTSYGMRLFGGDIACP